MEVPGGSGSGEGLPSFYYASHGRMGKGALWGLSYKDTNPIHKGSALHDLFTSRTPNTITMGVRISTQDFRDSDHSSNSTYKQIFKE